MSFFTALSVVHHAANYDDVCVRLTDADPHLWSLPTTSRRNCVVSVIFWSSASDVANSARLMLCQSLLFIFRSHISKTAESIFTKIFQEDGKWAAIEKSSFWFLNYKFYGLGLDFENCTGHRPQTQGPATTTAKVKLKVIVRKWFYGFNFRYRYYTLTLVMTWNIRICIIYIRRRYTVLIANTICSHPYNFKSRSNR